THLAIVGPHDPVFDLAGPAPAVHASLPGSEKGLAISRVNDIENGIGGQRPVAGNTGNAVQLVRPGARLVGNMELPAADIRNALRDAEVFVEPAQFAREAQRLLGLSVGARVFLADSGT